MNQPGFSYVRDYDTDTNARRTMTRQRPTIGANARVRARYTSTHGFGFPSGVRGHGAWRQRRCCLGHSVDARTKMVQVHE